MTARQAPAPQQTGPTAVSTDPEPTARLVRLDAIVTDKQGRPLLNLRPADFEVVESGVAQRIDAVEPPRAPQAATGSAAPAPILSAEDEVREARTPGTRVVALLLDEFHVSEGQSSERVREAALRFVDRELRPADLLVVFKPLDTVTDIRFTRDRDAARHAIQGFAGRKGNYRALTEFEEKYIGRAPATVQAARTQIVLSALRALTMKLGDLQPGRSSIVFMSEGFSRDPGRDRDRRVPDLQGLVRAASRYNVAIYAFNPLVHQPNADGSDERGAGDTLMAALSLQTGGEVVLPGSDIDAAFQRVARDLDSYYILSYTSSHGADGRFYDVQVRVKPKDAHVRARTGYWAPLRTELFSSADARPAAPARVIRRSPLIDTWLGLTVGPEGTERVIFTWVPAAVRSRTRTITPAIVAVKATTTTGAVLFEGELRAARAGAGVVSEEAAVFDAQPGRIQFDLSIQAPDGTQIDTAASDVDVPSVTRADPLILPPQVFRTISAREFRQVSEDPGAAPVPGREFRRTERLLVRVPTYSASGARIDLGARVLNRVGQLLREIPAMAGGAAPGVTQFDVPLAWLAPGEYTIEIKAATPTGSAREIVRFKVTG